LTVVTGLDLAPRHSAFVVLGEEPEPLAYGCSADFPSPPSFLARALEVGDQHLSEVLMAEDVPPIKRFGMTEKEACKLQGRLAEQVDALPEFQPVLWWLKPAHWQRQVGVWKDKAQALSLARASWPDLPDYLAEAMAAGTLPVTGKERQDCRALCRKKTEDLADAYLIVGLLA
jgi:hypothetical protein